MNTWQFNNDIDHSYLFFYISPNFVAEILFFIVTYATLYSELIKTCLGCEDQVGKESEMTFKSMNRPLILSYLLILYGLYGR